MIRTNDPCDDVGRNGWQRWAGLRPCGHPNAGPGHGCDACMAEARSDTRALDHVARSTFGTEPPVSHGRRIPPAPPCP